MLVYDAKHINISLLSIPSKHISLSHTLGGKLSKWNGKLFWKHIFHIFVSSVPWLGHFLDYLFLLMSISNVIIKLLFVTFDIVILHEEVRLVEQVVGAPLILNLTILNLSLRTIIIIIIITLIIFMLMFFIFFLLRGCCYSILLSFFSSFFSLSLPLGLRLLPLLLIWHLRK